jgi:hypothetical protein
MYSIALFIHIVGALGFFVALGVEWMLLRQLLRATTTPQIRTVLRDAIGFRRVGMAGMLALLVSGFYMMVIAQVGGAWVIVSFWSLVLLSILAVALSFRRMAAIGRAATVEDEAVSPTLRQLLHHPLLWIGIQTRVGIGLGIIFLMTVKPGLGGALLTIGIATMLGLASALPHLGRKRAQAEPAT